ncbi:D-alanyl-D-alanine dipeptidase [Pigmentiphaga humi]|uniref:D-alanyl-D-alanine dipeptidase n=1 Tax=Pigmentiphaga humi TaxID=2478468 RepID=A0A3P4B2Z0_9BURK|nr:M15 family metallopeptidase [Pigmentiphaga humi]VCU69998.1 D-alanyl-D-alanine dipeptidase [Pigmentiphaga humi]
MKNRPSGPAAPPEARPLARATGACLAAAALLAPPAAPAQEAGPPAPVGFVHLTDVVQTVQLDIRYHGRANFLGRPVAGYDAPTCIVTAPAAERLRAAQEELRPQGLTLKIFDCYRPQAAVNDFVAWVGDPKSQAGKAEYFPDVDKSRLLELGYIAERSGHSRGSTVDLTLAAVDPAHADGLPTHGPLLPGGEVDMGTPFDLFDVKSHTDNPDLPEAVRHNRQFLKALLARHGFRNLPEEWWHYTLESEPYPDSYFNFPVR